MVATATASGGTIETAFIEEPWPDQWVHETEVGRYAVRWRQSASHTGGIFAGVSFVAPLERRLLWEVSTDYADVGFMIPGVQDVSIFEMDSTHQVVQLDVQVLWRTLQLRFEIEREPPEAIRCRLVHEDIGEYRAILRLGEPRRGTSQWETPVELSTWLKPSRPVPIWLVLVLERMTLLRGSSNFLEACERYSLRGQDIQ